MVMVPWWQVTQLRSFLHVTASFTRNARPRSIAVWAGCCGPSPRADLETTTKTQKAAITTRLTQRASISGASISLQASWARVFPRAYPGSGSARGAHGPRLYGGRVVRHIAGWVLAAHAPRSSF